MLQNVQREYHQKKKKKNVILGLKMLGPETLQSKGKTVYGVLTSSLEERNSALKIIGGL